MGDQLAGRVALVSGATGHVGGAVAAALAEMGASVAVHCLRRRERAEALVGDLAGGQPHAVVTGDLSGSAEASDVFARAAAALGAAPTVVVDAAYPAQPPRDVIDLTDDYVERHLAGLRGHLNVARAALGGMQDAGWGRMVFLSGALAWRPFPGFAVYGAVKAAATAFARTLSLEAGPHGITVNVVALGRIERDGGEKAFSPDPRYEALDDVTRRRVALPRMASPGDVAATIRHLVSPDAGAVTGQVIFLAAGEPM